MTVKELLKHFVRDIRVSIYNSDVTVCEAVGTCGNIAAEIQAMRVKDWVMHPDSLIITLQ